MVLLRWWWLLTGSMSPRSRGTAALSPPRFSTSSSSSLLLLLLLLLLLPSSTSSTELLQGASGGYSLAAGCLLLNLFNINPISLIIIGVWSGGLLVHPHLVALGWPLGSLVGTNYLSSLHHCHQDDHRQYSSRWKFEREIVQTQRLFRLLPSSGLN